MTVTEFRWDAQQRRRAFTIIKDSSGITACVLSGFGQDLMTVERFLEQFGPTVDLLSTLTREKWFYDLDKDVAKGMLKSWRDRCIKDGFANRVEIKRR